jgi:hypothetical protein
MWQAWVTGHTAYLWYAKPVQIAAAAVSRDGVVRVCMGQWQLKGLTEVVEQQAWQ